MSDVLNNKGHIPNVGASSPSYPYSRYIVWHMMLRPDGFGKDKYIACRVQVSGRYKNFRSGRGPMNANIARRTL
mgnify:CR=1 FL=1